MAEWLGRGLQNLVQRFESALDLKIRILKRNKAYKMLSEYLNIPGKYTHIGMFQISTCYHVEKWANEQYRILKQNVSHLHQDRVEKLE